MALWGGAVLVSLGGLFQFLAFATGRCDDKQPRFLGPLPQHRALFVHNCTHLGHTWAVRTHGARERAV